MKNKTIKLHKDNSERGGDVYGKILVLTFEDSEEEILNHIISCVSMGVRAFHVIENTKTNLSFNGLEIDNINRSVRKQKREINLTFTEFEILYLLANNLGRVFSKEQIYNIVWKESYTGDYNIVMSHIRNLREKIEDNPSKPIYIQVVIGLCKRKETAALKIKAAVSNGRVNLSAGRRLFFFCRRPAEWFSYYC